MVENVNASSAQRLKGEDVNAPSAQELAVKDFDKFPAEKLTRKCWHHENTERKALAKALQKSRAERIFDGILPEKMSMGKEHVRVVGPRDGKLLYQPQNFQKPAVDLQAY